MADAVNLELALQGGGAHGAFTWGVLDRLLDEERLNWRAISGASAGALNAVAMADGLIEGGRAGAQRALWALWKRISREAHRPRFAGSPYHALFLSGESGSTQPRAFRPWWSAPLMRMAENFTRTFSPYQFNPFNLNPLIGVLNEQIDFARLRRDDAVRLFISATSVRTGGLKIFRNAELSAEAVMASACLPHLFQAVVIDGEPYWDGGYVGNPALLPLIAESEPHDLMIIQLNPPLRRDVPRTAGAIVGRLNEITFNTSLMKELHGIALLKQALAEEGSRGTKLRHPLFEQVRSLLLHRIAADGDLFAPDVSSKLDPQWRFLLRLHGLGTRTADAWLSRHGTDLGKRSTLDLETL